MDDNVRAALERLLRIAGSNTGQSCRVANFILAWWDAGSLGGLDLSDIFAVDRDIARGKATLVHRLADSPVAQISGGLSRRDRGPHQALADVWTRTVGIA